MYLDVQLSVLHYDKAVLCSGQSKAQKKNVGLKTSALKCLNILLNVLSGVTLTNAETLPQTVVAGLDIDSS